MYKEHRWRPLKQRSKNSDSCVVLCSCWATHSDDPRPLTRTKLKKKETRLATERIDSTPHSPINQIEESSVNAARSIYQHSCRIVGNGCTEEDDRFYKYRSISVEECTSQLESLSREGGLGVDRTMLSHSPVQTAGPVVGRCRCRAVLRLGLSMKSLAWMKM